MARLALVAGLLVLVAGAWGCGGDDVRQAVSNAQTSIAERIDGGTTTTAPAEAQTVVETTPARTQTVTETTPARTQTVTQTTTVARDEGSDSDDTLLIVVIVAAAALVAIALLAASWRLLRPEAAAWKTQAQRAQDTARWAASDLTAGLLDAAADRHERLQRWQAAEPVVDDAVRTLRNLSAQARHRRAGTAALDVADALAALADALSLHARSPSQDGAGLVRRRADEVLARLPTA